MKLGKPKEALGEGGDESGDLSAASYPACIAALSRRGFGRARKVLGRDGGAGGKLESIGGEK